MKILAFALALALTGCVTLPQEIVGLERAVKSYKGTKREIHHLAPGAVVTSAQLETFLERRSGPNQEGVVTYAYPGVVVYHLVAVGRFVIVSDRVAPGS